MFFDCEFLFEISDAYLIFYYFFEVVCVVLVLFFVLEAVFGIEEGAANVGLDGSDFGLCFLFVLVKLAHL